MKNKKILILMIIFMIPSFSFPSVSLPAVFADNMVLQRNARVKIWGWAKPGEEVKIKFSWSDEELSTKANKNAGWEFTITTPDVRGAQEIRINGYNEKVINNVLLGEVWLVSGQSNMEWSADAGIDNAQEAIAGANHPEIRFFQVTHRTANDLQEDLDGGWVSSTPETMRNFSAVAYFFGNKINTELNVPVGLINSSWGGTPAEVWMPADVFEEKKELANAASLLPDDQWGPHLPGKKYNAMIAPLIPYEIAGILWYQGESNTANADHYKDTFTALIESWRNKWQEELPFFYAQIAPFDYGEGYAGVKVRDAQRRVLELPKTGMVMTSDIGNIYDIHPTNKLDVGLRFANLALADVYGQEIKAYPPVLDKIEVDGRQLKVFLKNAEGLKINENDPASQFEIAGEDKNFYSAKAEIRKEVIHLKSPEVKHPIYARYSWKNIATSNIYNDANLPASSFTTEY